MQIEIKKTTRFVVDKETNKVEKLELYGIYSNNEYKRSITLDTPDEFIGSIFRKLIKEGNYESI